MSPFSSKYPSSSGSPGSSVARDSETRARENTRRRPARATLEESGRKSKHEGREAKASGVPDKVLDKIGISLIAAEKAEKDNIYIYIHLYPLLRYLGSYCMYSRTPKTQKGPTTSYSFDADLVYIWHSYYGRRPLIGTVKLASRLTLLSCCHHQRSLLLAIMLEIVSHPPTLSIISSPNFCIYRDKTSLTFS